MTFLRNLFGKKQPMASGGNQISLNAGQPSPAEASSSDVDAQHDVPGLINALKFEEDTNLRKDAARKLGELKSATAVEPLIDALNQEKDLSVLTSIATALGKIGDARAAFSIEAAQDHAGSLMDDQYETDEYYNTEFELVHGMKLLRKGDHSPELRSYWTALYQANKDIAPQAVDLYIEKLKDPDWKIRRNAACQLGYSANQRAVKPLIEALKDVSGDVRAEVASALGNIGDSRAVKPLTSILKDKEKLVTDCAGKALKKIKV